MNVTESPHTSLPAPHSALLLLGPTGAGKTPLGLYLERHGLWGRRCCHFDFGANLRWAVEGGPTASLLNGGELGTVRAVLESGALLEDHQFPIAGKILLGFLRANAVRPEDLLVLNGLPRHVGQAQALERYADVRMVISMECAAEVVRARIRHNRGGDREGRADDAPADVARKLAVFAARTMALLDHYAAKGVRIISLTVHERTTPAELAGSLAEGHGPEHGD